MTEPAIPDDMTELAEANIDRVDLVGKAANGHRFILAKSAFTPADVRAVLAGIHKAGEDDELGDAPDAVDLTEPLAEADPDAPGDATDPGSPAWESIDAATACKWMAVLGRTMNGITALAAREAMEDTASGDYDGITWDLQDACSALDYAMGVLAPYAISEAQDSQYGAEAAAAIGKAVEALEPLMAVTEGLTTITKAGRSLSAANETALRNAAEAIQKVLASLPTVPEDAPVTKETKLPDEVVTPAPVEAVTKADETAASGLVAVFDQKGNLVGVTDPANIQAVSGASGEPAAAADPAPVAAADPAGNAQAPSEMAKSTLELAIEAAVTPLLKRIDDLEHTPVPTGALFAGHRPGTADDASRLGEGLSREDLFKKVQESSNPGDKMLGLAELIKRQRRGE